MLTLTYIPVDDDHEPAVVEINTMEMVSTDTGIQYHDPKTGMDRSINYNKLLRVEFAMDVPQEFKNRANNLMKLKKMNKFNYGRATVR